MALPVHLNVLQRGPLEVLLEVVHAVLGHVGNPQRLVLPEGPDVLSRQHRNR